jgi:hypothetical protein
MRSPSITITQSAKIQFLYEVSTEGGYDLLLFRAVKSGVSVPGYTYINSGVVATDPYVAYPANHPSVIAVGATAEFDYRSDFSQYGEDLDVVAPGAGGLVGIVTTDRTGTLGYDSGSDYTTDFGGTSASSPITAGTMALLLSRHPDLTATEARTLLRMTAEKVGRVTYSGGEANAGGLNLYYGYGRVHAGRLLSLARARFQAGDGGVIAPPNGLTSLFCASGSILSLGASPNTYYGFDSWQASPPEAATLFQPAATETTAAILDDVVITGAFAPLRTPFGTPHYWLAGFGLDAPSFDVAELSDSDGDGHAAWQEWRAGTHPLDPDSVLKINDLQRLPDGRCVLAWHTVAGRTYDLLASGQPEGSDAVPVAVGMNATPPINVYTSAPLPQSARFLRVRTATP